jgi:GT2 family glycosyltransferase
MSLAQNDVTRCSDATRIVKDVAVIIVSYNTRDLLGRCLDRVAGAAGPFAVEVVVVDNASADGSADMVAERFPSVQLIRNRENRGFAAGCNQGIEATSSEFVLLLNSDAFIDRDALEGMISFMREVPEAGVCGACLIERDDEPQQPPVRFPTPLSGLFNMTALGRIFPGSRHNIHRPISEEELGRPLRVDWVSGACFLARRKAIDQVGTLDEGYFLYFEETDWCRRMAEQGWATWYLPEAKVWHLGGESVDQSDTAAPFDTYHPRHMLNSRRRHMRKFYGVTGMLVTESLDVMIYAIQFLKNCFRFRSEGREKARGALTAIGIILGLKRVGR